MLELKIMNSIYFHFFLLLYFISLFGTQGWVCTAVTNYHTIQSQVMVTQSHVTEEHGKFQNNDVILHVNSIQYTYPLRQARFSIAQTIVRHSSHWGKSPQDGLGNEWTCGTILASAYMLCHLSTIWSQLQIIGRSPRWE